MMRHWGEPPPFVSIHAKGMTIEELKIILSIWESKNKACIARGEIERWIRYKEEHEESQD
jgi:hypothetical protein